MTFSNIITKITPLIHVTTDLIYKGIMTFRFRFVDLRLYTLGYNRPDLQRDYDQGICSLHNKDPLWLQQT